MSNSVIKILDKKTFFSFTIAVLYLFVFNLQLN